MTESITTAACIWPCSASSDRRRGHLTLTLTLKHFLFLAHSDFVCAHVCVHVSVDMCACVRVFVMAAAAGMGASCTIPVECAAYRCTSAFACPIPCPRSLGWVSGAPLEGEARDGGLSVISHHHSMAPLSQVLATASCRLLVCRFN